MITVVGRKLVIPEKDSQIGTTYDNNSEARHIRLNRITTGGVDLANLRFKLDLEYEDAILDTCLLDAEVQEAYILLTWHIPATCVSHKGTVWIAVRAYDENGTIKWATNPGAVYAGHTIFDGEAYKGHLAEFEQLEERITQKAETLDANESKRQEAEEQRKANEERRVNNEAEWQRKAETAIAKANTTLEKATTKAEEAEASSTAANQSANTASQAAATATNKAAEAERSAKEAKQIAQGLGGFNGKASSVSAADEQGLLGEADGTSNVQALLDALAQKVALELVSNSGLAEILSGYIATSSINNTGLVTEEGFVADARQMNPNVAGSLAAKVKKNTDDIVTANSNLGNISADLNTVIGDINPLKSNYVSHINVNVLNKVNLVLWDVNTADTPFKTGNTVYGNGFCIIYSSGVEQWLCQLAMAVGDSHLFTRHCREGVWSGWTTIGSPSS